MNSGVSGSKYSAQEHLASYWKGKCEGSLLPSREDIDPTDLADILPCLRHPVDVSQQIETFNHRQVPP